MKSLKNYLADLTIKDCITLTLSNTRIIRGTYIATVVTSEVWGAGQRIIISSVRSLDGGHLHAADVWINTETGCISKIVARGRKGNGTEYNRELTTNEKLCGCNLRTRDIVFSRTGAVNIKQLADPVYDGEQTDKKRPVTPPKISGHRPVA